MYSNRLKIRCRRKRKIDSSLRKYINNWTFCSSWHQKYKNYFFWPKCAEIVYQHLLLNIAKALLIWNLRDQLHYKSESFIPWNVSNTHLGHNRLFYTALTKHSIIYVLIMNNSEVLVYSQYIWISRSLTNLMSYVLL